MKTYTKEQLIAAQIIYTQNVKDNPDDFVAYNPEDTSEQKAIGQIEYLLGIADNLEVSA